MIWESFYWKEDIRKTAQYLNALCVKRLGSSERRFVAIEKRIMIGFYMVRKLIESEKISSSLSFRDVRVNRYAYRGVKEINIVNRNGIEELYDMDDKREDCLALQDLCHYFVHSYVFIVSEDESGFLGSILFNSDRTKDRYLCEIDVKDIASIFVEVADNYPSVSVWTDMRSALGRDYSETKHHKWACWKE